MQDKIAAFNERVKLLAGLFDKIGIALMILALIRPLVESGDPRWFYLPLGLAVHSVSYYIVGYTKRKD